MYICTSQAKEGTRLPGTGVKTVVNCYVSARSRKQGLSMLLTVSISLTSADISVIHCLHKLNFGFLFKSSHVLN